MSKKGLIAAVVVVALITAGAGLLLYLPVEIEVKDTFKVGDKHTLSVEIEERYTIKEISGDPLSFKIEGYEFPLTYVDLKDEIEDFVLFDEDTTDMTTEEKRIDTDFGKRDCTVYTYVDGTYTAKHYVGESNGIYYKFTEEYGNYIEVSELKKSNMFTESPSEFKVKEAKDLKVGDSLAFTTNIKTTNEIEEVKPAEGENPEEYRFKGESTFYTRDEVIDKHNLVVPEIMLEDAEQKGKETVKTPLGRVACDVYIATESGTEHTAYLSNGILVKVESEGFAMYWSYSDFIVKKNALL